MLPLYIVSDLMYQYFEGVKESKNGTHFLAKCVLCGDSKKSKSKKRFNLDFNRGSPIYHCFNCGKSGSFLELYSELKGLSINDSKKELFLYNPGYLIQRLSNRKKEKVIKEIQYVNHNYIKDKCISMDDKQDGYIYKQYLLVLNGFYEERKIPREYKLFICIEGDYKNRIIIPIYDRYGDIIYFQGRSIPGSNILPKYKNPTIEKSHIILNKHIFDKEKYIIVTEGIIDALMIGNQGTTCLGVSIIDIFIEKLKNLTNKGIIIALDNDEDGIKFLNKILNSSKYCRELKYFLMPGKYKDLNEFVVKNGFDKNSLYDFILSNSYPEYKTRVLLKMR